jgi:hypothetical protein
LHRGVGDGEANGEPNSGREVHEGDSWRHVSRVNDDLEGDEESALCNASTETAIPRYLVLAHECVCTGESYLEMMYSDSHQFVFPCQRSIIKR